MKVAEAAPACPARETTVSFHQGSAPSCPPRPCPEQQDGGVGAPGFPYPGSELTGLGAFILVLEDILDKRLGSREGRGSHPRAFLAVWPGLSPSGTIKPRQPKRASSA